MQQNPSPVRDTGNVILPKWNPLLSLFRHARDPSVAENQTLSQVVDRIRGPEFAAQIATVRALHQSSDLAGARLAKEALPAMTLCGMFSQRSKANHLVASGLIQFDIDKITPERREEIWALLLSTGLVAVMFRSPTVGIKGALHGPVTEPGQSDEHVACWAAMDRWLSSLGIAGDTAVKDVSRLCFLSHDPGAYLNLDAPIFAPALYPPPAPAAPMPWMPPVQADASAERKALAYVRAIPSVAGEHGNNGLMAACRALERFNLDRSAKWRVIEQWNAAAVPPWSAKEIDRALGTTESTPSVKPPLGLPVPAVPSEPAAADDLEVVSAESLVATFPAYRPALIEGLLREGETMNIIAAPKTGKSWLVLGLAFSIANGLPFLGRGCAKGNVLILDNELHQETAAQRLRFVANAMQVPLAGVSVISLRGKLQDLVKLAPRIKAAALRSGAKLIVLDALYRLLPSDVSENDNAGMMSLYNEMDGIALASGAAIVAIHHSSKGNQGDKGVTDGGAGAGSISRAADSHVFLREHETEGQVVVDAVARSWPPPMSVVIGRPNLVWEVVGGADPDKIKGRREKPASASPMSQVDLVGKFVGALPESVAVIAARIKASGSKCAERDLAGQLGLASSSGLIVCETGRYGTRLYGRAATPGARGTMEDRVRAYLVDHPNATNEAISEALDCSSRTVYRVRAVLGEP